MMTELQLTRQYSSQHAFPIWTPAWPICTEIHSLCKKEKKTTRFVSVLIVAFTKHIDFLLAKISPRKRIFNSESF